LSDGETYGDCSFPYWVYSSLTEKTMMLPFSITSFIRRNAEDIRSWASEDDVFIVDRGFRDALLTLEDLSMLEDSGSRALRKRSKDK
jgi:hypothetical protein